MKTYSNFNEMFNANSGVKSDLSVFNEQTEYTFVRAVPGIEITATLRVDDSGFIGYSGVEGLGSVTGNNEDDVLCMNEPCDKVDMNKINKGDYSELEDYAMLYIAQELNDLCYNRDKTNEEISKCFSDACLFRRGNPWGYVPLKLASVKTIPDDDDDYDDDDYDDEEE